MAEEQETWVAVKYCCPFCEKLVDMTMEANDLEKTLHTKKISCHYCNREFLMSEQMAKGNLMYKVLND